MRGSAGAERRWPRSTRAAIGVAVAIAAIVRIWVASRSVTTLDRFFIPDDTYYTLGIAHSIAQLHFPAFQRVKTSGFQPLLAFLEAPVFWFTSSHETALRYAEVLLAVCDALTTVFVARIAYAVKGSAAAIAAAVIWALSPVAIDDALAGLETSLAIFAAVVLVDAWMTARRRPSTRMWAIVGALCSLAVLARVDIVMLVAALVVFDLYKIRLRHLGAGIAAGVVVIAPWWLYCWVTFGSPIPESGAAVQNLIAHEHYRAGINSMGFGAGTVLGGPVALLKSPRSWLYHNAGMGVTVAIVMAVVMGVAAALVYRYRPAARAVTAFFMFGVGVLLFYTLYLPALYFNTRYEAPLVAVATVLLASWLGWMWSLWAGGSLWPGSLRSAGSLRPGGSLRAGGEKVRSRRVAPAVLAAVLLCAGTVVSVTGDVKWMSANPRHPEDSGLDGAKGYQQPVKQILAALPPGSVVGAMQAGALGYFAPPDIHVVNLDGVVNHRSAAALKHRRLAAFCEAHHVTYFADWDYNLLAAMLANAGDHLTLWDFQLIASASTPQNRDRFRLWKIYWPLPGLEGPPPGAVLGVPLSELPHLPPPKRGHRPGSAPAPAPAPEPPIITTPPPAFAVEPPPPAPPPPPPAPSPAPPAGPVPAPGAPSPAPPPGGPPAGPPPPPPARAGAPPAPPPAPTSPPPPPAPAPAPPAP